MNRRKPQHSGAQFSPQPHTAETLATVVAQVAKGDRAAFGELYQATYRKLFGIVLRVLKQQELAEEILQEVYLKIWEKAGTFDATKASPITWMATIARNRSLDEIARKQLITVDDSSAKTVTANDWSVPGIQTGTQIGSQIDSHIENQIEKSQELMRLESCLDGIGHPHAAMVKLAYLDGLSRQLLAEHFEQPVGTIKTWIHRSLKQLKTCLETRLP